MQVVRIKRCIWRWNL